MKELKTYILRILTIVAVLSFPVMVWGLFIHLNVMGFYALLVFGFSSSIAVFMGLPERDKKNFIDHGRNLD